MAGRATPEPADEGTTSLPVVLFDGSCRLCVAQARTVRRIARGRVAVRPLQEALADLPWVDPVAAASALTLVRRDGRTAGGAEAIVELLRLARPALGAIASIYYLPGVRGLADAAYRFVAARRYTLFGRTPDHPPCGRDACGRPP